MGLGRIYHPDLARCRLSAMAGSGTDLQLVELICPAGQSQGPHWKRSPAGRFCSRQWRARRTHGGAQHLTITSQHAEADKAKSLLTAIHALITRFKSAAEQFKIKSVWQLVCEHILTTVAHFKPKIPSLLYPPTSALVSLK